jgi:hypothetical protein
LTEDAIAWHLFLQEQAAKEALAAELAARGVVEEGKKKVRTEFVQSNFMCSLHIYLPFYVGWYDCWWMFQT